eukprot:scaffold119221_cov22-Tisochrysis_lutea.AAC.1
MPQTAIEYFHTPSPVPVMAAQKQFSGADTATACLAMPDSCYTVNQHPPRLVWPCRTAAAASDHRAGPLIALRAPAAHHAPVCTGAERVHG